MANYILSIYKENDIKYEYFSVSATPSVTVCSANNPVTYILSTAKLNAAGRCWVSELVDFNITEILSWKNQ